MREASERDPLLLDVMLGKLASYLRMCGYDAAYALDRDAEDDDAMLALAHTEGRRLVTRDEGLARQAPNAVLLTEREVEAQLRELAAAGFELELTEEPARCGTCNAPVERVDRTEPTPDYAPDPAEESVWRCRDCGQHFWRGSHWDDVADTVADL
ncbi:Mut7-C RNAse domain-containing protein [Halomicroarcula limicola]|uniref:Mut7-C RNAse domain-containing protein n=1 Tax=Haloarcula limicola TaxID=1429915 RepID=A0A8J7Y854_9EURY|nr:Mut7-C RNAse domain-containing protein [Halomicroarcula limicola]MBV0923454.1 Mut7-C RNAse domain-containing protein [Halomicroarcula limicola]